MKKQILFFLLTAALLFAVLPVQAGEELFWSNMNDSPVRNRPPLYKVINVGETEEPVLVQRIRTYHWNSGEGAEPGTISVYEGETEIGSWKAVGRSGYGASNVYWDALVDVIFSPGHSYTIKDSDLVSMSYNEASDNCGMFEVYGVRPVPEGYIVASPQKTASEPSVTEVPITLVTQNSVSQEPVSRNSVVSGNSNASAVSSTAMIPVDTFQFGRYEQDNNSGNGTEAIEWQVLTVLKDRQLVVSRYILDYRNFSDSINGSQWDSSAMRTWLNGDFYNNAFTAAEKNSILLVTNSNPNNERYGTPGGSQTQDRIFLLSIDEANRYFTSSGYRVTRPTASAQQKYDSSFGLDSSAWLLRSPGAMENTSAFVNGDGSVNYEGSYQNLSGIPTEYAVRPAFWMSTGPACLTVKYIGGSCLSQVPTDKKCYKKGDKVTVLFDPVEYVPGLIFNGWDRTGDGTADHGYYYNSFIMPDRDVELTAICYRPYQPQYNNQYYDGTIIDDNPQERTPTDPDRGSALYPDYDVEPIYDYIPDYSYDPDYSYVPDNDYSPNYNIVPDGQWWNMNGVG
ncbi:MAG: hypothetical protein IJI57_13975 [Flexilinea sp.]|nr:hypothetical protein [Flexilinea sp.]